MADVLKDLEEAEREYADAQDSGMNVGPALERLRAARDRAFASGPTAIATETDETVPEGEAVH